MPLTYSVWKLIWIGINPLEIPEKAMTYHFLNLLFHTINACLVFKIFTKLNISKVPAFLGVLIFLVHPVQVESLAWISEFKGLFAFFWSALAAIQFINWKNTDKKLSYFLAILYFALALLSKPSVTTLPILFTAIWFFTEKKHSISETKLKYFLFIAVFFVMSAILAVITKIAQPATTGLYEGLPIYCRIIIPFHVIGFYLSQLITPFPLVSIYPEQLPIDVMSKLDSQYYWLLGFLAVFLPIRYKNFRWLWLFALLLLPNSGIVPFDYQLISVVADRYQYLVMPIAIFGLLKLSGNINIIKITIITVIIIILAVTASKRTDDWMNAGTIHYSALKYNSKTPHLYINLSEFLINTGQFDAAEKVFELADNNNVTSNLLDINRANRLNYIKKGDSAEIIYNKIIESFIDENGNWLKKINYDELMLATMNYGLFMFKNQNYNEVIRGLNVSKALVRKEISTYIKILLVLSETYIIRSQSDSAQAGDLDSAVAFSTTVLSIEKENIMAICNKSMAFYFQDDKDSAFIYLEKLTKESKDSEKNQKFVNEYVRRLKKQADLKNLDIKDLYRNNFNTERLDE
jgi:tetratricopeptide (TPR) repeat protein